MASHAGSRIARISKVLVANRGEIAVRVIRAASDVVRARSAPVAAQTSPNSNAHSMRRSRNRYPLTCSQVVAGLGTGSPTVAR